MRIPRWVAWTLLLFGFFTAGLLRQNHDFTPEAPMVSPVVGSLIFGAVFLLLLVSAREWSRGAVKGRGIRLGSLTPILLMLLIEKWISLTVYPWGFTALFDQSAPDELLDARFRGFAGVLLILLCLLIGRFSAPTARKIWRRAQPGRWPIAALGSLIVIVSSYVLLGGLSWALGGNLGLELRPFDAWAGWTLGGQAVLAFAEELYYRGLLMSEMERLAPRLGLRGPVARRWSALLFTAALFGMEHFSLEPAWDVALRQLIFTISLGLLLGILVMVSANLHYAAGVHAWINWLLLGVAPCFVDAEGNSALPAGPYIGVTLILAFVLAFLFQRLRRAPANEGRTSTVLER